MSTSEWALPKLGIQCVNVGMWAVRWISPFNQACGAIYHRQCPAETFNAIKSISLETMEKLFMIRATFDTSDFLRLWKQNMANTNECMK